MVLYTKGITITPMLKLQTFPISEFKEANAFTEKHPPRSTDKQSGIVFHNGSIVIIYDDGKEHPEALKATMRTQLEGDREKRMLSEHSLAQVNSALADAMANLASLMPEGYKPGMANGELRRILEASGKSTEGLKPSDFVAVRDTIDRAQEKVDQLEAQKLMDEHEITRLTHSITAWEHLLTK